jgi:hypothetical protein
MIPQRTSECIARRLTTPTAIDENYRHVEPRDSPTDDLEDSPTIHVPSGFHTFAGRKTAPGDKSKSIHICAD